MISGVRLSVAMWVGLSVAAAFGAVASTSLPMTLDTRFRIASMSKPITTVAVLMLYDMMNLLFAAVTTAMAAPRSDPMAVLR